jgi:hypothetical protein
MEEEAMKGNLPNPEIAWLFAGSFFCLFLWRFDLLRQRAGKAYASRR